MLPVVPVAVNEDDPDEAMLNAAIRLSLPNPPPISAPGAAAVASSSSSSSGGGPSGSSSRDAPTTATKATDETSTDDTTTKTKEEGLARVAAAAKEESALLDALRPWVAAHSADDLLHVLPTLRLDLVPLDELRRHVQEPSGSLHAASNPSFEALRGAIVDQLLPGVQQLRCASQDGDAPHELTCCITMELMTDPVVAQDGQSYERSALAEYWKREGKPISPITREELKSKEVFPNVGLRKICSEFAAKHKRVKIAASEPAEFVLRALLSPPPTVVVESKGGGGGSSSSRTAVGAKRKLDDGYDAGSCAVI